RTARLATLGAVSSGIPTEALRRAAVRATWAPSVRNTQPWRFVIGRGALEVHADYSRQLRVLDPSGRQLVISCGCAVFNARVSLAADGFPTQVRWHLPDEGSGLLTELVGLPGEFSEREKAIAALDPVLSLRRANRRRFVDDRVPADLLETLTAVAAAEGARAIVLSNPAHRTAAASLSRWAEAIQLADQAYRAELRAWVTADGHRDDGVPIAALLTPAAPDTAAGEVPQPPRPFADSPQDARLPGLTVAGPEPTLLLLGTDTDDAPAWLQAGEALERLWLEVARAEFAMSLFTEPIEVPAIRELLRARLGLAVHPHVLLRIGRAPATVASRRRKLVEVLRHATRVEGV
ncbi:MAG: hypothetical protein JO144_08570, partial [Actinobacteria bacterium]|nr:hypothetical protein [Actinomycetota bacterium]